MNPDRIVLGVQSRKAENILREVYKPLKARLIVTDMNSAELIKHASNSFLATKISFINAMSQICQRVGADVLKVAEGMGCDKRIGKEFLCAGIGYGGSCFPKDVDAFIRLSENSGFDFALLKEVKNINEIQKKSFVKMVQDVLWNVKGKTIGVLGLSFKPNTDDMRSAPSVDIIKDLQKDGAKIKAYDPQAMGKARSVLKSVHFCKNPYEVARRADCLLLLTEWEDFRAIDLGKVKQLMNHPLIFDGRNFFCKTELEQLGFEYFGVGVKNRSS
jgi:UDPglucose 6-dehydrogenase